MHGQHADNEGRGYGRQSYRVGPPLMPLVSRPESVRLHGQIHQPKGDHKVDNDADGRNPFQDYRGGPVRPFRYLVLLSVRVSPILHSERQVVSLQITFCFRSRSSLHLIPQISLYVKINI
ncbi:m148 protein [Murid betaherpesvirus 1]|nr:m148 protein [Murid betaherpesvirus 1]